MPILIVPGLNGSGPDHWQSLWERDIPDAYRVMQTDWARPDCVVWLARLIEEVERRPGAVLVGHSLGATLIAHLAAARPELPVGGALLVAPADPTPRRTEGPGVISFSPMPTAPFPFPAIVVASRNDPHMVQNRAMHLAQAWKAHFVDAGASGHLNSASGHGRWPQGRLLLQSLRAPLIPLQGAEFERGSANVIPLRRRPSRRGPVGDRLAAP
jgi:predicted alpha/beta hydrolase family esterase